jgi:integrase
MAVRQLKNGSWQADVVVGWKIVKKDGVEKTVADRRTKCFQYKKDAKSQEAHWQNMSTQHRDGRGLSGRITFKDFLDDIYWPQKKNLRANTVKNYKRDIKLRLLPAFGDMPIEDIGRMQIQNMLDTCATRKVATNARETLSSILGVAFEMELIPRNTASYKYNFPPASPRAEDDFGVWLTSFDEIKKVLEYAAAKHDGEAIERMLVLGLCFGLRKGEVLGLDWERVDLEKREVCIMQTFVIGERSFIAPPKTPKSERNVPMLEWAYERMKTWKHTDMTAPDLFGNKVHPVVANRFGYRLSSNAARKQMAGFREEEYDDGEKLPHLTLMSCRHSFATTCIRSGMEVSSVSRWLGHEQISTTYNRYVKPLLADLHTDAAKLNAIFADAK